MRKSALFLCGSVLLCAASSAFAQIIPVVAYDQPNSVGTVNINGNALASLGDDITLAPGAGGQRLVSISVGTRYFFDATHTNYTPNLTLSVYDTTTPGTDGTGHLLASSTVVGAPFVGVSGSQDQTILFPFNPFADLVPQSFYIAVSQNNFDNNFALHYDGNPTIGSTVAAEFGRFQSNPNFQVFNIGGVTGLQTTITVPEPATLSLLGVAGLLGLRRRRLA